MSGRLIISSKKSYCPWNAKNLRRIERDEEEHLEAQKREREKHADISSRARVAALKKAGCDGDGHAEHINLFELEEKVYLKRLTCNNRQKKNIQSRKEKVHEMQRSILNTHENQERKRAGNKFSQNELGRFSRVNNTSKPFYLLSRPEEEVLGRKEMDRKREMDPMKFFHENAEEVDGTSHRNRSYSCVRPDRGNVESISCVDSESKPSKANGSSTEKKRDRQRFSENYFGGDGGEQSTDIPNSHHSERKKKRQRKESRSDRRKHSRYTKEKKRRLTHSETSNDTDSIDQLEKNRTKRRERERKRKEHVLTGTNTKGR